MQVLESPICTTLLQLENAINTLSDQHYTAPVEVLSSSSIGQHVRHIIELFQSMNEGYSTGMINYDTRKREKEIESNKSVAVEWLQDIRRNLQKENRDLILNVHDTASSDTNLSIRTNYYRELHFNLQHLIHHMAIIRIAFNSTTNINLPEEFGIAPATLKHKRACAPSPTYQ